MSDTATADINTQQVPTIANGFRLQFEQAQDTWVLLYPEGMVKLNPSAAEILKRCDGQSSIEQIITQLEDAFDAQALTDDVLGFLRIALEQYWISLS